MMPATPETPVDTAADTDPAPAPPRKPRGFASWNKAHLAETSRKGGVAAHKAGTAHTFTSEEAKAAGRKGGRAAHAKRKAAATPKG